MSREFDNSFSARERKKEHGRRDTANWFVAIRTRVIFKVVIERKNVEL